mmetsp:Transcript_19050/g.35431  ORF Transcript_19050/g.35431 Transcript_19050/m.35431 type:complete len:137 (-) Transcript_19050:97-507(-)
MVVRPSRGQGRSGRRPPAADEYGGARSRGDGGGSKRRGDEAAHHDVLFRGVRVRMEWCQFMRNGITLADPWRASSNAFPSFQRHFGSETKKLSECQALIYACIRRFRLMSSFVSDTCIVVGFSADGDNCDGGPYAV